MYDDVQNVTHGTSGRFPLSGTHYRWVTSGRSTRGDGAQRSSSLARVQPSGPVRGPFGREPDGSHPPQRRPASRHRRHEPQGRRPVAGRDRDGVPRRGAGHRQGPDRGGHRARRPGRPDLPHPLRVGAVRLRDLERGRGHRPRLRDQLRRAGPVDPRGLRRRRRHRGEPGAQRDRGLPARPAAGAARGLGDRAGRPDRAADHAAPRSPTPRWTRAAPSRTPTTPPRSSTPRAPPAAPRAAC